jgi:hypothetical protein
VDVEGNVGGSAESHRRAQNRRADEAGEDFGALEEVFSGLINSGSFIETLYNSVTRWTDQRRVCETQSILS